MISATAGAMDAADVTMSFPRDFRYAVSRSKGRPREAFAARLPLLRQEVASQPVHECAKCCLLRARREITVSRWPVTQGRYVNSEHRKLWMHQRAALEKGLDAAGQMVEQIAQTSFRRTARGRGGQISRSIGKKPAEQVRRHQATSEEPGEPLAQSALPELGEDQRHVLVFFRQGTTRSQRAIERFLDQAQDFRVVGKLEPRIDISLERKLAQKPQAECVDRRDGDVAEAAPKIAPSRSIDLRHTAGFLQALDDSLPHFRGRFPRKRDRQNVVGIDAGTEQIDVALHQHAGLSRAGRRLEDHVVQRIDGIGARVVIGRWTLDSRRSPFTNLFFVERQPRIRRHQRSPSCRLRRTRRFRTDRRRLGAAETRLD